MATNESVVFIGLSELLKLNVIKPIINYLYTKGIECTDEELWEVLKLEPQSISKNSMGSTPPNYQGKQDRRSRKINLEIPEDQRCKYIFIKGLNIHKQCIEKAENGNIFCKYCKDKKSAKEQEEKYVSTTGETKTESGVKGTPSKPKSTKSINLRTVKGGLCIESKHDLLLRPIATPNEYVCIGVALDSTGYMKRDLLSEDIKICEEYGISYVDPNKANQNIVFTVTQPVGDDKSKIDQSQYKYPDDVSVECSDD